MDSNYLIPCFEWEAFSCPNCNAFSHQQWSNMWCYIQGHRTVIDDLKFCLCVHCKRYSLWKDERMIYPNVKIAPLPNKDLELDIQADYMEAREIIQLSPRGACALLRLALQKLMIQLWESWKDINKDIGCLVQKWLNSLIQQSLDLIRVTGNEAIHPWTLDLKDDVTTATMLFDLINLIADSLISQPKKIKTMYDKLPQDKLQGIVDRDSANK